MDYKEWIQNRAEELALELYEHEYQYLPTNLQELVYFKAEAQFRNHCTVRLENIHDRIKESV